MMKRIDDGSHAGWHEKAAEQQSRVLQPAFWGTVTSIQGVSGTRQVQVARTGKNASDGQWHFVQVNGQVPLIGDIVQLEWRDTDVAVVTSILSAPRVVDQHNLHCRLTWTGSASFAAGWNWIGFNTPSAFDDPSSMAGATGYVTIAVPGRYLIILHAGVTTAFPCIAGIYLNDFEQFRGTEAVNTGGQTESLAVGIWSLSKGDTVKGFIFTGTNSLISGADATYMIVNCLQAS